jgi:2-(1,2-epoxy-1,2-dihydrophenyl)acetyl-CoA isomerase
MVEADEALRAGLVTEVVPPDRLLDRAVELGELIAQHAPAAVARVKAVLAGNATNSDIAAVMRSENAQNAAARLEPDHKEAVAAFVEKRKPNFQR